jgi:hypothetical protein
MVHASAVSLDEMRSQLLTLDQVRERLAVTEPLSEVEFTAGDAEVRYEPGWAAKTVADTAYTGAYLRLPGGNEYQFTKQGALELGAVCHMPRGLQAQTPPDVLAPFINWWLANGEDVAAKELKALCQQDKVAAVTRGTVNPFSNLRMLDTVIAGVEKKYGQGEVLADYKFHHNLEATALRLIVPGQRRVITGTSVPDDTWSVGIDYRNSLTGLRQTSVRGYLFRWWCTNGCIDTINASPNFSRRGQTEDDAVAWASVTVDEVLAGLEPMLDNVQGLTAQPVTGDVRGMLEGLFDDNGITVADRHRVIGEMAEDDEMTAYSLLNAVTVTANLPDLDYRAVDRLMGMGGHIVSSHSRRCDLGKVHRVVDGELVHEDA